MNTKDILHLLSQVVHPEKNKDIVSLGWVQNVQIGADAIALALHFPSQRDPFANTLGQQCERLLKETYPTHSVQVDLQFAAVQRAVKTNAAPKDTLPEVKKIIAVMSGKGGVGKSTVSVNIALMLAQKGYKVGIVDADIYGPSLPKMFGVEDEHPTATEDNLIVPVEKYGVKMLSIGFFVKPADALLWRAPMVVNALKQLLLQAQWGALDFLFIDMPPGTGDIHLSLVNELKLAGAVVVSTPQQVALADARKSISLLQHESIHVKILGVVENMAWFTPAELPQNKYYIFGKAGAQRMAAELQLPLLAEIPLVQSVCEDGDAGIPSVLQEGAVKDAFEKLTDNLQLQLTLPS
ncbi:iron-sulfur cluster carrier protein [Bacteroidia bacterium]|nr:iron-sulfur cluster carrier protein [Bacteroidia bacterium]